MTDVYSLGVLLHAMWYRTEPFQDWAPTKVVIEVATKGTRPKFEQDPVPPASLIDMMGKMWQQDHRDRPQIAEVREMWSTVKAEILGEHAAVDVVDDGPNEGEDGGVVNPIIEATTTREGGEGEDNKDDEDEAPTHPTGDP